MLAYALRRTDAGDAHDVVAETFLVAWRRFDDVPRDPLPWLLGVARRVLANQRRAGRRRASLHTRAESAVPPPSGGDPAEAVSERLAVRAALARLPEWDREALMLVAWDGIEGARAAAAIGCPPGLFGVRLHRARRRLRRELAAEEERAPERRARTAMGEAR